MSARRVGLRFEGEQTSWLWHRRGENERTASASGDAVYSTV